MTALLSDSHPEPSFAPGAASAIVVPNLHLGAATAAGPDPTAPDSARPGARDSKGGMRSFFRRRGTSASPRRERHSSDEEADFEPDESMAVRERI